MIIFFSLLLLFILLVFAFVFILKKKNMSGWLPQYIKQRLKQPTKMEGPTHIIFSFVDHYDPQWGKPNDINVERSRVDRWLAE
jgi:hypothetical protein